MIIRIMGEGQYQLSDADLTELKSLDAELKARIEASDEEGFRRSLGTLLDAARSRGTTLADDTLEPAELVLPASDASLDEVRDMLGDDGLISG